MLFILLLTLYTSAVWARQEWIDPHSMDHDEMTLPPHKCASNDNEDIIIKPYYERMLSLLVTSFKYDADGGTYKSRLELSVEDFELLKKASKSLSGDNIGLNKLDAVLSKAWERSAWVEYGDMMLSWNELLQAKLFSQEAGIVLAGMAALFFVYNLMNAKIRIWKVLQYMFFFAYVIDFVFTWISLVKKAEIEQMADSLKFKTIPAECDPDKVGWFKSMFFMNGEKCREYHRVHLLGAIWTVSPMKVFGTQIGDLVYTPAHAIGAALGEFTKAIIGSFSWYMLPVIPFLLLFILIIICILLSFMTNTALSFNFMYIMQLKFGEGRAYRKLEDSISGNNLHKFLGIFQQPAIESKKEKKSKKNEPTLTIENLGSDEMADGNRIEESKPEVANETAEVTDVKEFVDIENIDSTVLQNSVKHNVSVTNDTL